ncbi:MAG: stage II sporulation protein P [Lachnospiraceae bacterium]|nr:stage II sporulation protein P [Lachnospiraceae bacterium]
MKRLGKWIHGSVWAAILGLGLYVLVKGLALVGGDGRLEHAAAKACAPAVTYSGKSGRQSWLDVLLKETIPLFAYWESKEAYLQEDRDELIVLEDSAETETETYLPAETEGAADVIPETETQKQEETEKKEETDKKQKKDRKKEARTKAAEVNLDALQDFTYLLENYYTVDASTTADPAQINADALLSPEMQIEKNAGKPQILIYHTHSQEAFADSVSGDVSATIVGMGDYLTELLTEKYGYCVIHNTSVFDMIDGKLDRNAAYNLAEAEISQILEENPSVEVVIDLHRDGLDGEKMVTDINGKPTAKIMFFNGLSRTARNGAIDYLPNPYIAENLAFSFQLQLKAEEYYPGFTRNIYLQSLRYNLHLRPRALLVEAGSQLNTVEEEKNAMEPLADILDMVLSGK